MRKLAMPFQVGWDITHLCNCRCKHCYLTTEQLSDPFSLPRETALAFVRHLGEKKVFHLSIAGGEPLLYPFLDDVIACARSNGMLVAMSTNAMLLTEGRAAKLRNAGLTSVQISLDGSNAAINDYIRGNGRFRHAIEGIKIAVSHGFKVVVATVIVRANKDDIEAVINMASSLGAYGIKIQTLIECGLGLQNRNELAVEERELRSIIAQLWEIKSKWTGKLEIMLPLVPEAIDAAKNAAEYFNLNTSCLGCQPGLSTIRVNSHGDVRACGALPSDEGIIGNISVRPLQEIWLESQELVRWRNESEVGQGRSATSCGSICGNGCRSTSAPKFAKSGTTPLQPLREMNIKDTDHEQWTDR